MVDFKEVPAAEIDMGLVFKYQNAIMAALADENHNIKAEEAMIALGAVGGIFISGADLGKAGEMVGDLFAAIHMRRDMAVRQQKLFQEPAGSEEQDWEKQGQIDDGGQEA